MKQEIREKSSEQKSLRSEKKGTSIFNVKKQMELSQRIAELTEDLEELRSERTMLLNQLDCADDKEVKKVKTSVSTMKDTLKNLPRRYSSLPSWMQHRENLLHYRNRRQTLIPSTCTMHDGLSVPKWSRMLYTNYRNDIPTNIAIQPWLTEDGRFPLCWTNTPRDRKISN